MSIWYKDLSLDDLKQGEKGLQVVTGIRFTEIGDDYICATMPVDERTVQPMGILHGGASCVLAETVGSIASHMTLNPETHFSVGIDIHTSHIRSASSGVVTGKAKPIHIGRSTQIWEIPITNAEDKLVSITRLTMFVKER